MTNVCLRSITFALRCLNPDICKSPICPWVSVYCIPCIGSVLQLLMDSPPISSCFVKVPLDPVWVASPSFPLPHCFYLAVFCLSDRSKMNANIMPFSKYTITGMRQREWLALWNFLSNVGKSAYSFLHSENSKGTRKSKICYVNMYMQTVYIQELQLNVLNDIYGIRRSFTPICAEYCRGRAPWRFRKSPILSSKNTCSMGIFGGFV